MTTCDELLTKRLEETPAKQGSPDYSIPSGYSHATYRIEALERPYGEMEEKRFHAVVEESHVVSSEVVSSEVRGGGMFKRQLSGTHTPLLDIDMPAALVPSSTEGHFHLYIDKEMTWREYKRFLRAMMKAGIIEKGYYKISVKRKATHLRLPWIKKVVAEPVLLGY